MSTEQIEQAIASIRRATNRTCSVGLVLGSGLSALSEAVTDATRIPFRDIDGFSESTAPGHEGSLVLGELHQVDVAVLNGRLHLYEGWRPADIALPIRTLRRLGADVLVVTNAAGALNETYVPGDIMLIEDHLNFTGANPLIGRNDDAIGLRYPDMSRAYDAELRTLAVDAMRDTGVAHRSGIYAAVTGPSLETSAERRFLRSTGADAIGMSTVPEVIAAVHCGLRVIAFSAITNMATGGPDQEPDSIEAVHDNAAVAASKLEAVLTALLGKLT